jgi:hypothetical protein
MADATTATTTPQGLSENALDRSLSASSTTSSNSSSSKIIGEGGHSGTHYIDLEAQGGPSTYKARGRGASVSSAITQKDIYCDLSTKDANLRRQETLQELRSVYSRRTENEGELDAPDDASELKNIDPELVTW